MTFYCKDTPQLVGKYQFKVTTGIGVPGYNPKCSERGEPQIDEPKADHRGETQTDIPEE